MNIPPWRRRGRPRTTPVDNEAISTPRAPTPQVEPQVQPEFQVPPMPQPGFFPLMTLKVFQAYINFWYAQTQAQAQIGQTQYLAPPTVFAQPSTQPGVKLSKLIKKARQLSCETFLGSVDAVVAKNWLKKFSNTLADMKLDDDLKLRVATRLINKSVATWWDNLKLHTPTPVT